MKTCRIFTTGPESAVFVVEVDPPLQPGEVEVRIEDFAEGTHPEVAISRTVTPRMDVGTLFRLLRATRRSKP